VRAGSVEKSAILKLLNNGHSVLVVVGGGSESLLSLPGRYDLVLNRRKGFVRVALETGCSLVPVVGYGETESYRTINQLPHDSWLRRWQRKIEKTLGFTVPICIGVGLFMPFGILPYPVPLNIVIGKPVDVPKYTGAYRCIAAESYAFCSCNLPLLHDTCQRYLVRVTAGDVSSAEFHALVDKHHALYVEALVKLFNEHKEKYAKEAADIVLIE